MSLWPKNSKNLYRKLKNKLDDKLTIKMINSDDIDLSIEIKFEGSEQTVEKGEKSFIKKLEKYKEKLAKSKVKIIDYKPTDIEKLNKKKKELEEELIKYSKLNKKDKIKFPDTWTWENMDKEGNFYLNSILYKPENFINRFNRILQKLN